MRGTTPTHVFSDLSVDLRKARVYVTYNQFGINVLEKTNEDLTITENSITLTLSQEESLKFKVGAVAIQIRYVLPDGKADASNIMNARVDKILKDGVIVWS